MNQANLSLCDNNVAARVVRAVPKKPLADVEKKTKTNHHPPPQKNPKERNKQKPQTQTKPTK